MEEKVVYIAIGAGVVILIVYAMLGNSKSKAPSPVERGWTQYAPLNASQMQGLTGHTLKCPNGNYMVHITSAPFPQNTFQYCRNGTCGTSVADSDDVVGMECQKEPNGSYFQYIVESDGTPGRLQATASNNEYVCLSPSQSMVTQPNVAKNCDWPTSAKGTKTSACLVM